MQSILTSRTTSLNRIQSETINNCRAGSPAGGCEEFYSFVYNAVLSSKIQQTLQRYMSQADRCLLPASCWLLTRLALLPGILRRRVPPECRLTFAGLQVIISQKTEFLKFVVYLEIFGSKRIYVLQTFTTLNM
jgi:hypothetical protein